VKIVVRPNPTGLTAGSASNPSGPQAQKSIEYLNQFAGPGAGQALYEIERAAQQTRGAPGFAFGPDVNGGGSLEVRTSSKESDFRWNPWINGNTFENPDPGHYIFRSNQTGWSQYLDAKVDANGKLASIGIKDSLHLFTNSPDLSWSAD
jgi:hypothetical protein